MKYLSQSTEADGTVRIKYQLQVAENESVDDRNGEFRIYVTKDGKADTTRKLASLYIEQKGNPNGDVQGELSGIYNGHRYEIFNQVCTWEQAYERCIAMGGHLVTFESTNENKAVLNMLGSKPKNCYWIGLQRNNSNKSWEWITGEQYAYKNWAENEPNNFSNMSECYVHMYGNTFYGGIGVKYAGTWNDLGNEGASYANEFYDLNNFGFICEWDDDTSNEYRVWYMLNEKRDEGKFVTDGTIQLTSENIGDRISIYLSNEDGSQKWHPSYHNQFYYEVKGDEGVLSLLQHAYQGDIVGAGEIVVNIWDSELDRVVGSTSIIIDDGLSNIRILVNGIVERYDGEIQPDDHMSVIGVDNPDDIAVYVGEDIVKTAILKRSEQEYAISLPVKKIWNPNNEVIIKYKDTELARYAVDPLYNGNFEGCRLISEAEKNTIVITYNLRVEAGQNFIASIASSEKYSDVFSDTYSYNNNEYQPTKNGVVHDNAYKNKISVYGMNVSEDAYIAVAYSSNSVYPHLKTEFVEYPIKLSETSTLKDSNGNELCEIEFYLEDKWFQVDKWDIQRVQYGISTGFAVVKELYGGEYTDKLYKALKSRNGNKPIKVFFVDTDVELPSEKHTLGANMGDYGIIYMNADALVNRNTLSATIAHELQHYYYALTVKDKGFMNEVYSNYCDNLTALRLQNSSGEWGDLYGVAHDVIEHLANDAQYNAYMGNSGIDTIKSGLTKRTKGNYYMYTAFGYYLQHCTNTGGSLVLKGGMSKLLNYLEEEAMNGGESLDANYRALYRAFSDNASAVDNEQAEKYFTDTILPDFQTYLTRCRNAGSMV